MTDTLPNLPTEGDENHPQAEYVGTEDVDATHAGEAEDDGTADAMANESATLAANEDEEAVPSYKRADDSIWD